MKPAITFNGKPLSYFFDNFTPPFRCEGDVVSDSKNITVFNEETNWPLDVYFGFVDMLNRAWTRRQHQAEDGG